MKYYILLSIALISFSWLFGQPCRIEFFKGEGCPHCIKMDRFLSDLNAKHPSIELSSYEVYYNPQNRQLFIDRCKEVGTQPHGVPTVIIDRQVLSGFNRQIADDIEKIVVQITSLSNGPHQQTPLPQSPATPYEEQFSTYGAIGKIVIVLLGILFVCGCILILFKRKK